MNRKRVTSTLMMVGLFIFGAGWIWLNRIPNETAMVETMMTVPRPGFQAPPLMLESLDGDTISLKDLRGRVVIVNFWASWCYPCRSEMPALQANWENWRDQGLVILAINLQESPAQVRDFANPIGLSFPLLLDKDGSVFERYQVQLYPTTFFIGRDGVIQDVVYGGPMTEAFIGSKAAELLE